MIPYPFMKGYIVIKNDNSKDTEVIFIETYDDDHTLPRCKEVFNFEKRI